jgi:hypothetical protein
MRDFAQAWRSIDKVVYSRTLENVSTARTRMHSRPGWSTSAAST